MSAGPGDAAAAGSRPLVATGRLVGIDLARALALCGMVMVHVGPTDGQGVAGSAWALPHGRAAVLFALVAGVGIALLAGDRTAGAPRSRARLRLLWRAALLLPLGLALQALDHGVLVILAPYAVLFALAAVVIGASDRLLLALAALSALAGPLLVATIEQRQPGWFSTAAVTLTDPPAEIARELVISGPYPVVTWAAPMLVGIWLGRRDLRAPATWTLLLGIGAAAALALGVLALVLEAVVQPPPSEATGWWAALDATPHSQGLVWLVGSTATAVAAVGVSLATAAVAPRAVTPLVAAGQLALTLYVAHLVTLDVAPDLLRHEDIADALVATVGFLAVGIAGALAWRQRWARGPLELVLAGPWAWSRGGRERAHASDPQG